MAFNPILAAGLNASGDPPSDLGVPALLIAYTGT